jgi:hypothetical protein
MYMLVPLCFAVAICCVSVNVHAVELFAGGSLYRTNLDGDFINPQTSDYEFFPSLGIKSLDRYWGDTAFGYFFAFDLDSYKLERQDAIGLVTKEIITTSMSGHYLYFTPTVFYDFTRHSKSDWSVKVGVGVGAGYLTTDGTLMVNTPPGPRVEQIKGSDFSYSTGIIIRYEYKNLFIQAKEYTPFATIDGLELELQLAVFTVGYKYAFD